MKTLFPILEIGLTALILGADLAAAWGPQGHRIAAELAEPRLTVAARNALENLLGEQTLAEASNWADQMRSNPAYFWQKQAGPYHYVTVPRGKTYLDIGPPGKGDAITALANFCETLLNPAAARAQQQLALRFSLHIIQDLHQPMHVGNGLDRGGNQVKLTLNGKRTNLHRVWDSALIGYQRPSAATWAELLPAPGTQSQQQPGADMSPLQWVAESAALRDRVYPSTAALAQRYLEQYAPAAAGRLAQAGARSATYLNQLFSPSPRCPTVQLTESPSG